ncbi:MAG TPA: ABC transporter permease [Solirubrobacteraceae bacterium]|jgi:spermidine/putrescine transport system permease protein|nr:ABC transporter permease [Solirubrobacteraceae bacterium]
MSAVAPEAVPAVGGSSSHRRSPRELLLAVSQYLGFAPAMALFGLFFLAPMGLIVAYSFWTQDGYNVVSTWTLSNYQQIFSTPVYVSTFLTTLWMTAAATALTLAVALPFAYWLARYVSRRWQRPLLFLVILPFWVSYLLRVTSWTIILGSQGAISRLLSLVGLSTPSWLLYDRPAVIFVLIYLYFPFAALTLYASLERFDWSQLHAAMDLGATQSRAIRRIMLPQIKPGITTAVIFVFIPILGEYLTPELVGGTRGVMIGNLIDNFFQEAQYATGAAVALLIVVVVMVLLVIFRRSLEVGEMYGR